MANRFSDQFDRVSAAFDREFGMDAEYIRGTECHQVTVFMDPVFRQQVFEGEVVSQTQFIDFVIRQNATPFSGIYSEPQRKDTIRITVNGRKRIFEALPDQGQDCFEDEGGGGLKYRIHTKEKPS